MKKKKTTQTEIQRKTQQNMKEINKEKSTGWGVHSIAEGRESQATIYKTTERQLEVKWK